MCLISAAVSCTRPGQYFVGERLLRFGVREVFFDFRCAFKLPRFGLGLWLLLFVRRFLRA